MSTFFINPYTMFPSGGGSFAPSDVAGLHRWYKAESLGLADDALIASFTDLSGNGGHATQATSGLRPVYKTGIVNGKAIARFDAVAGNYLDLGDLSSLTEAEVFIVIKINNDPPSGVALAGLWRIGTDADWVYFPFTDGSVYDDFGSTVRKSTGNPTPALTSFNIYNVWSASGDWASAFNGSAHFSTGTNTPGFATACYLGASDNGAFAPKYLDGDIAEVILYDNKIDSGDRADVITYLQGEYGL